VKEGGAGPEQDEREDDREDIHGSKLRLRCKGARKDGRERLKDA
jgi:hypothetical protein